MTCSGQVSQHEKETRQPRARLGGSRDPHLLVQQDFSTRGRRVFHRAQDQRRRIDLARTRPHRLDRWAEGSVGSDPQSGSHVDGWRCSVHWCRLHDRHCPLANDPAGAGIGTATGARHVDFLCRPVLQCVHARLNGRRRRQGVVCRA